MKTLEYRYRDRSGWPSGPWDDEPDKIQFADESTGLPCLIVRNPSGVLCGYVGVAEGHPWFANDYGSCADECGDWLCDHRPESAVDVHGGLTFADFCAESDKERGICHVPDPGEPDRVWWFGFDCAHSQDVSPLLRHGLTFEAAVYRTVDYVKGECARLAAQLKTREPVG